jgi:hypothetical protein
VRHTPISDGIDGAIDFIAAVAHPEDKRRHDRFAKAAVKCYGGRVPLIARGIQNKNALASVNEGLEIIGGRRRDDGGIDRGYRFRAVWLALRQMDGDRPMQSYRKLIALFRLAGSEPPWNDDFTVQQHVWRSSLPALAMAFPLAWRVFVEKRELLHLLYAGDWVADAFDEARKIAPDLAERFPKANLLVPCKAFFSGLRPA